MSFSDKKVGKKAKKETAFGELLFMKYGLPHERIFHETERCFITPLKMHNYYNNLIYGNRKRLLLNSSAIVLLLFIVIRWFFLINEYSVNMLFWDQWDFTEALFDDRGLLKLFTWQHGPHRQGAGFFLTKAVAVFSGWNTRVESFMIGMVVCLAALTALFVKLRTGVRLSVLDLFIPLIYLSPLQVGLFASTPNVSHGAMPLLLITLFCLCWMTKDVLLRYTTCAAINFMTIYTGFGLFLGCITPVLFLSELAIAIKQNNTKNVIISFLFFIISVSSIFSFFIDYTFNSAAEGFVFPHPDYLMYVKYILITFSTFCGIRGSNIVLYTVAVPIVCCMIYLAAGTGFDIARNALDEKMDKETAIGQIIIILITFTLVFSLNLAVGRVCLGLETAASSRYLTYLTPGFFAIYLLAVTKKRVPVSWIAFCMVCFFVTTFSLGTKSKAYFEDIRQGKQKWKQVYLQTENIRLSDRLSGFAIHPNPSHTHLKQKINYLKENRLNLYLDASEK